jgi:uncharacterized protein (TIGR02246 family)
MMKQKRLTLILVALLVSFISSVNFGQESAKPPAGQVAGAQQDAAEAEIAAIRAQSEAFVAAFNKQDVKAVAALWTTDGEYMDDAGRRFVGRDAIEKGYAEFFTANPKAKIQITIDSLRVLASGVAIEEGRAAAGSPPADAAGSSQYTVTHVKVDGKWLMASVRDALIETPATVSSAADLQWLVGAWIAEERGIKSVSVVNWVVGGRFLERQYTTTLLDGTTSSGVQLIGWNPLEGHVQSWNFSPDGGHAVGIWIPSEGGWTAQMRGMTGDGAPTTSINQLLRLDDNAFVWRSFQRTVGNATLADTDEIIWKRQPASR